jgi:hypothetical protein
MPGPSPCGESRTPHYQGTHMLVEGMGSYQHESRLCLDQSLPCLYCHFLLLRTGFQVPSWGGESSPEAHVQAEVADWATPFHFQPAPHSSCLKAFAQTGFSPRKVTPCWYSEFYFINLDVNFSSWSHSQISSLTPKSRSGSFCDFF